MTYYISRSGQQFGPYSEAELRNMLSQGQVAATDSAWGEGMAAWAPVSEILSKGSSSQPPARTPTQYEPPPAQPQYPTQPQYQPQAVYGGGPPVAGYGVPAYGGYAQQPVFGAVPPSMHWAILLLLGCVTGGIFLWIWAFIQARFVKKIDQASKAVMFMLLAIVLELTAIGIIVYQMVQLFQVISLSDPQEVARAINAVLNYVQTEPRLAIPYFVGSLGGWVFGLIGIFSMRNSIQRYYNSAEPIGLRLSGVMTFFFNFLYFQYHFRRIARWKQTGQLY